MSEKFLEIKNLSKHYDGVMALKDVNFDLVKGEIHCLVGQNGSGKSTLIKIIAGVLKPDDGSAVEILGENITTISSSAMFERGIRVIYQDLSIFPNLSVAENIAFSSNLDHRINMINWDEINKMAQTALDRIQVKLPLSALVSELSIADRQLVAIARALNGNAQLIIMDEPTSSLTRKEVDILFSVIKDLQKKGLTILFVSHKLDEILEIAERITVLKDGVNMGVRSNLEIDDAKLAYMITGEEISYHKRYENTLKDKKLMEIRNYSRDGEYQRVNLDLYKGETLGIIGLLGSGRTELALSIFGITSPDEGELFINGEKKEFRNNRDAIKAGVAYVPEDRISEGLVTGQNIKLNITITILNKIRKKFGIVDGKIQSALTERWIDQLQIKSARPELNASTLSGGNQQKVVLSKWLATEPKILILDEPTNGVDVAAKSAIYDIIKDLASTGMGIILISDEVPEIYYNCSRAIVMHEGRIKAEINTDQVSEREFYQYVIDSAE